MRLSPWRPGYAAVLLLLPSGVSLTTSRLRPHVSHIFKDVIGPQFHKHSARPLFSRIEPETRFRDSIKLVLRFHRNLVSLTFQLSGLLQTFAGHARPTQDRIESVNGFTEHFNLQSKDDQSTFPHRMTNSAL